MVSWNSFTKTWHKKAYASISPQNPSLTAKGKTVLITGGGRGIGKSIAIGFAQAGASTILITGRSKATMASAAAEIKAQSTNPNVKVAIFEADIVDPIAMKAVFETTKKEHGLIDILVSNAGYLNKPGPIASAPLDDYWATFEVNVKGTLVVAQEFLRAQAGLPNATFISINSGASHIPYIADYSAYAASKMATLRVVEYLAQEVPEMRFFQVQPGTVDTDMQRKAGRDADYNIDLPAGFCVACCL